MIRSGSARDSGGPACPFKYFLPGNIEIAIRDSGGPRAPVNGFPTGIDPNRPFRAADTPEGRKATARFMNPSDSGRKGNGNGP
ncbi:MAG: hypothetical protein C6W56_04785 [Caldibacillus debilis]|nr:MAG: hypothetical protein C6W56_04785 [Caldibacillus debilis]